MRHMLDLIIVRKIVRTFLFSLTFFIAIEKRSIPSDATHVRIKNCESNVRTFLFSLTFSHCHRKKK